MGPRLRRLSLRRLRARGVAAASPAGRPAVRDGAARERGRRRSAYEAPPASVAPGPVSSGAESKRRRCPRSRARQSRVTLLARYGATHGIPEQTSTTAPPIFRNSDFCVRAAGELRGSECGSAPVIGAVFVVGGVAAPLSQMINAEPSNG